MIMMPMRDEGCIDSCILLLQSFANRSDPSLAPLACVNEKSTSACAKKVSVCTLKSEFAWIAPQDAYASGTETFHGWQSNELRCHDF
jgi:hypothetical protein